jgi:hypothetical protein
MRGVLRSRERVLSRGRRNPSKRRVVSKRLLQRLYQKSSIVGRLPIEIEPFEVNMALDRDERMIFWNGQIICGDYRHVWSISGVSIRNPDLYECVVRCSFVREGNGSKNGQIFHVCCWRKLKAVRRCMNKANDGYVRTKMMEDAKKRRFGSEMLEWLEWRAPQYGVPK